MHPTSNYLGALSKKDTYLIIVSSNLPKGPRPSLKSSAEKQSKSWDMASPNTFCNSSFEPIEPSSAKKNYNFFRIYFYKKLSKVPKKVVLLRNAPSAKIYIYKMNNNKTKIKFC